MRTHNLLRGLALACAITLGSAPLATAGDGETAAPVADREALVQLKDVSRDMVEEFLETSAVDPERMDALHEAIREQRALVEGMLEGREPSDAYVAVLRRHMDALDALEESTLTLSSIVDLKPFWTAMSRVLYTWQVELPEQTVRVGLNRAAF